MSTRGHLRALPGTRQGDALVTVDEVGRRLGCSRRTVFRLLHNRELPSTKVGRQRLIAADDVDRYVDKLRAAWLEKPTT